MNNKISIEDYRKLQESQQKGSKAKNQTPKKIHSNDKKVDYKAICLLPQWKAETSFGITTYTLPMPPSANEYWRSFSVNGRVRVVLSQKAKSYKEAVGKLAYDLGMRPLTGNVHLMIQVYRNQASGDLSNRVKVIEDALIGVAFLDDNQVTSIHIARFDDKGNGRIVIAVTEASK